MPKSFWLAYTVSTWFFFPLIFVTHPDVDMGIKIILIFHLISWWIRGSLELVMIYKWFNWSPRYGISHDFFHLAGILTLLWKYGLPGQVSLPSFLAAVFIAVTIFATMAELLFAYLFLQFRSKEEADDNIYFASDDPKWIFINRVTLSVVCAVMGHLIWQSFYVLVSMP